MKVLLLAIQAITLISCTRAAHNKSDWKLIDAGLYTQVEGSNYTYDKIISSHEGLLIVHFEYQGQETGKWLSGTVCDDSYNTHAANLTCQYLGYSHVEMWGSSVRSNRYIHESFLDKWDIHTLIDEVKCEEGDEDVRECEAKVLEGHDCSRSEDVWLQCAEPNYVITDARLARWNNETGDYSTDLDSVLEYGNEGVLMIKIDEHRHEHRPWGTVCSDYFNDLAANLSCQGLGYKYAESWGSDPDKYVPWRVWEGLYVDIIVDDVQCDEWAESWRECEARIGRENDCDRDQNVWLKCSDGEDDDDDKDEEEEEGGLVSFEGGNATLTLNKFHRIWRF